MILSAWFGALRDKRSKHLQIIGDNRVSVIVANQELLQHVFETRERTLLRSQDTLLFWGPNVERWL